MNVRRALRNAGVQPDVPTLSLCDCVNKQKSIWSPAHPVRAALAGTGATDRRSDATLKRNRERRIPTPAEMPAFSGAHCRKLYAGFGSDWRCPG